ncbi:E3 ubiquitin-protein ligase RNF31 [Brachionichthys hirsutus]|uniref:E3 ubiquitin-protein ligase RNF31 n=1 Tax=Brachionichthys hirsutus TaxID=412623 RepID=UPI00360510EC
MPRVRAEAELRTLKECRYPYPAETLSDLQMVRSVFSDLHLFVDFYCFPNKVKKKLVYLKGTITCVPVHGQGSGYHFPVCIWLHEMHPVSRPRCYVCPSVSMVINPSCPCVDAVGNIALDGLTNWTPGVSNLLLLVSEMRNAFQKDTPLYSRRAVQAPPPADEQLSQSGGSLPHLSSSSVTSQSSGQRANQQGQNKEARSYTEELLGIDFSAPSSSSSVVPFLDSSSSSGVPPPDPLSRLMGALRLDGDQRGHSPGQMIITMTHCSCFLCQTCFKTFFSSAIKEKSVNQLVCPQCGKPEIKGHGELEESVDYFNLLDTQIRHFLPSQIHELFQRKLRDRALQEMPNFRWCAHCSFGMLHEADRLRMDCPSCKKSTCCQCRSPWSPQHQGLSCDQFGVWQQRNRPEQHGVTLHSNNSIECPNCQFVFGLSRGGCLHFTCSLCQHQFCGGCSRPFRPGSACGFSAECGTRGLHAHHPRDCIYHLRDWSLARLHLLLQHYKATPTWLEPANGSAGAASQTGVCLVSELKDDGGGGGGGGEQPCGRAAPAGSGGYCQTHYKERLVELVHRCHGDPAVVFSLAEMRAELRRWNLAVPERAPDESELVYEHRLRQSLCGWLPLTKRRH